MNPAARGDVTTASLEALLRLAEPAAALSLKTLAARATPGGPRRAPFRGRGMEFDEVRPYQPGDDIARIDWKVTARTGDPHTKLYREERERPVLLVTDLRPTMRFATRGAFKSVVACHAAAALAWVALRGGDRVGGALIHAAGTTELRPQRGRAAVLHLLRSLAAHSALPGDRAGPPLATALARVRRVARPGSIVVLASDFADLDAAASLEWQRLGRHNDTLAVHVYDPLERELPPPGRYPLTDGARRLWLDTAPRTTRGEHAARFERRRQRVLECARKARGAVAWAATDADPVVALATVLRGRHGPLRAAAA